MVKVVNYFWPLILCSRDLTFFQCPLLLDIFQDVWDCSGDNHERSKPGERINYIWTVQTELCSKRTIASKLCAGRVLLWADMFPAQTGVRGVGKYYFYLWLNAQSSRCEGSLRMETPIKKKLGWLKKNLKLILAAILVELIAHFLIEGGVSILFNKFHGSDIEDECRCNKSSHGHSHNNWMPESDGRYPQNPSHTL